MFTGIIETTGILLEKNQDENQIHFLVESNISKELKPDQSVSHDGVCLTITQQSDTTHRVTAVEETLIKTNLKHWQPGRVINLERAMILGERLDGHIVQGHVDSEATCIDKQGSEGNLLYRFQFPEKFAALIIEKGSICINGVSLTVFNVGKNEFSVTIIPYTFEHTNFKQLQVGDAVNIEYDLIGKYLLRREELK